jgi:hypothetical protein
MIGSRPYDETELYSLCGQALHPGTGPYLKKHGISVTYGFIPILREGFANF